MKRLWTAKAGRPGREAIAFVVYDLILITLTYLSPSRWMMMACAFLSMIVSIRVIALFGQALFSDDEATKEESDMRIDGAQE